MSSFRLTPEAWNDYKEIGRYTQQQWDAQQRNVYLDTLTAAFRNLAENPHIGRRRDEIRADLHSYPCKQHIIFYRQTNRGIEILRLLHHAREVRKAF